MSKRILFVDDDRRFREIVLVFIRGRGFEVVQASCSKDAELELQVSKFDLLIVDGELPDYDGVTLIKNLRQKGITTPVIFVSGSWKDTDSYRELTEGLSVAHVLHKPVPPAVIADHIEKITGAQLLSAREEKVRSALDQLAAQYAQELPQMVMDLQRDIRLGLGNKEAKYLLDASRKAHTIKGSSGSYGFLGMTQLLEQLEDSLKTLAQEEPWSDETQKQISQQMSDCKSLAEHIARTRGSFNTDDATAIVTHVLLLAQDKSITQLFESFVGNRTDTALTICRDADELTRSAALSASELIFIEVSNNDLNTATELCKAVRSTTGYDNVPIVFITGESLGSPDSTCHYYGAVGIINRPLDPEKILNQLNNLVKIRRSTFPKVVMFDDDKNFVRRVEMALNSDGLCVVGFTDSSQMESVLDHATPDLVLLDVEMPGTSGFDICRRIRRNPKYKELPVVMVTARQDWETRLSAYESGADDYLSKPIVNAELVVKAKAWIERSRRLAGRKDSLTELLVHSAFEQEAGRQLRLQQTPQALVLFKVTNLPFINETYGVSEGNRILGMLSSLLRRRFRTDAVRGRWSASTVGLLSKYEDKTAFEDSVNCFTGEFTALVENLPYTVSINVALSFARESHNIYSVASKAVLKAGRA